jgi:hypothetical protein
MWLLAGSLALAACDKEQPTEEEPAAGETAAAEAPEGDTKPAKAAEELDVPKLGNLDEVDFETVKKQFKDAGWEVSGSATKSAMYAITINAKKGDVEIKVQYYKNGGDFWDKSLDKDGATVHKAGDVIVGVNVVKGDADPKKILAALVG